MNLPYSLAHILIYVILVVLFAVVFLNSRRRRANRLAGADITNPTDAGGSLQKKRMNAALFLAAVGVGSVVYGLSEQVPSEQELTEVAAHITSISTVHRTEENSNQSASSINPFASNWWIELTVVPTGSSAAGTEPRVWKVNAAISDEELRGWIDTDIVGLVKDQTGRSEAFELKNKAGETLVSYDATTQSKKLSSMLFLSLGAIALLAGLLVYLVFRPRRNQRAA